MRAMYDSAEMIAEEDAEIVTKRRWQRLTLNRLFAFTRGIAVNISVGTCGAAIGVCLE